MLLVDIVVGVEVIVVDQRLGRFKASFRISALTVGLSTYLPPSVTAAIIVGSLLNLTVNRKLKTRNAGQQDAGSEHNKKGVLIASGFIVSKSLMGVVIAIAVLASLSMGYGESPFGIKGVLASLFGANAGAVVTTLSVIVLSAFAPCSTKSPRSAWRQTRRERKRGCRRGRMKLCLAAGPAAVTRPDSRALWRRTRSLR